MAAARTNLGPERGGASPLHTIALVVFLLLVSLQVSLASPLERWPRELAEPGARALLYARVAGLQLVVAAYVGWSIRRSGGSLRRVVEGAPWTPGRWARYTTVGLGGLLLWLIIQSGLALLLKPTPEQLLGVAAMLPHSPSERILWAAFVLCTAACEELVYRGYLMRQLRVFTGRRLPALLIQACLYSLGHLGLSPQIAASVAILGILLGAVTLWQRSLVPATILHVGTGLIAIVASGPR